MDKQALNAKLQSLKISEVFTTCEPHLQEKEGGFLNEALDIAYKDHMPSLEKSFKEFFECVEAEITKVIFAENEGDFNTSNAATKFI